MSITQIPYSSLSTISPGKEAQFLTGSPSTTTDGGLSSRIPRLSRRSSMNDGQKRLSASLNTSFNTSFESPLNKSMDPSMLTIRENVSAKKSNIKRHHSIYERGEHDGRENLIARDFVDRKSPTSPRRSKSPIAEKKKMNSAAVRRNKSFCYGEGGRLPMARRNSSRPVDPPRLSSSPQPPQQRSLSSRRGTAHTLDVARKEGIIQAKSSKKTAAVDDPGRVQVFVRVRPPNETEDLTKHPLAVSIADEECTQLQLFDGKNDRHYQFDGVVGDKTSNKEVFKTVGEPLVYSALSGFNGILMCYGQTGTGKTYTLMSNDGMSVRIVYQCFKVINADVQHKYTVTCSYLQIYQEKLYDLLNETRTIDLSLREHPKTGVYIENLTEYVVHSPKEVLNLLKVGKRRLVFAETQMNRASSRSHAICQLKILKERVGVGDRSTSISPSTFGMKTPDFSDDGEDEYFQEHDQMGHSIEKGTSQDVDVKNQDGSSFQGLDDDEDDEDVLSKVTQLEDGVTSVHGRIYICDLAGSERIKKTKAAGERLQEAQHINSSLLELGNVIQALADGNRSHVPFRNSTLTRLLQEGLSGNCKTRLVVCCAPTVRDVHETKCSLNFGSRAMKVQVMAHVNYEVDYKKLAEALAAKLEALENDWNIQSKEYEALIAKFKSEVGQRQITSPMESNIVGLKTPPKHVQSLLITEMMTLQLFYNLQGNSLKLHQESNEDSRKDILTFSNENHEMMLQSMEGLLELLSDYMRDQTGLRSKNYSTLSSSGNSSVITSPDYIEQTPHPNDHIPSTLEPVSRFIEHAQITSANNANTLDGTKKTSDNKIEKRTKERLQRVVNHLLQLKDVVNKRAVKYLKDSFENTLRESDKSVSSLNTLDDIVAVLDDQKDLLSNFDSLDDIQTLENSLYYLQMDKAFLSCLVLLKTQTGDLCDGWKPVPVASSDDGGEVKRVLEELTSERSARDKLQDELYSVREEKVISEEKLKDIELELRTVRELKDNLESKLHAVEDKNAMYEEQLTKLKSEKEEFEKRLGEIEKRKQQLESSLKSSDNNNARKERLIVDLKNEKVALDSLVSTLKEEIGILEKERTHDQDERRHIEEELEDVRDRNIILETEWSCCREENGLLENELTALEEDKAILEDEIMKYRDDVKMLEEAVSVLEAQGVDYKQDILNLKAKEDRLLASVKGEKEKFNKELNTLRQEMSTLRVERRRFQRDISVSRADKSNTERAYNALKVQKDSLQDDVSSYKVEEKRLLREITTLKSDRAKLEREVNNLKSENTKLKQDIVLADRLKVDCKLLMKNEEKIAQIFNIEKDKICENLVSFKEKFSRMEQDLSKINQEKEKLAKQLKRFEHSTTQETNTIRRAHSQPTTASNSKPCTPDKRLKTAASVHGALARRSVHSGEVSEVEGKVLDLQRRLAFFMAEKEDIQKELICTRERNKKLTDEIKTLEDDTSTIQNLLTTLTDEKQTLLTQLNTTSQSKALLEKERDELKEAVTQAQTVTSSLRHQLEEISEQNRVLEIDQLTIKDSVKALQSETVLLVTENKHIKIEFEKVDHELKETRSVVSTLNQKLNVLKTKVKEANNKENSLMEQVSMLEFENSSLSDQLGVCEHEEFLLCEQLTTLNNKFHAMEATIHEAFETRQLEVATSEHMDAFSSLEEANIELTTTVNNLKIQLDTLSLDVETLKTEREEIQKLLSNVLPEEQQNGPLVDNIRQLKEHVFKMKKEKKDVEIKIDLIETHMKSIGHENQILHHQVRDKSSRLEQEKLNYKQHIDSLQQQIEELVKERIQLEAEVDFLQKQNAELRREIAIILEDNTKLETELETLESQFDCQEKELESVTEETKALLRQLCSVETENLNLCTLQSAHQEDVESYKRQLELLKKEKTQNEEEKETKEEERKTLKDRLIMAELEISKLKADHATVDNQRRLLIDDLDAADRERTVLKSELNDLARALSPLKKEVTEVIKRTESLQNENETQPEPEQPEQQQQQDTSDEITNDEQDTSTEEQQQTVATPNEGITHELVRIKEDLTTFHAEKAALEYEQVDLENRLRSLSDVKKDLRFKLRSLIQDLNDQNNHQTSSESNIPEDDNPIQVISSLITQQEDLSVAKDILSDELQEQQYKNKTLNVQLNNTTEQLRSSQEQMCLGTVERLKLKEKLRRTESKIIECQNGSEDTHSIGISPLQYEVSKLKQDIEQFESTQVNLLSEVRTLNEQLCTAENNIVNIAHFKQIIERNLRQYKERNTKLEKHLRIIYKDLLEMESHMDCQASSSAKVLLETLDLQRHFQTLEDDLRSTESQNKTLKEDASDLRERFATLEEEKEINTVSTGYIQDSIDGQHSFISQLQKEKEELAYEKARLQTKLSLYKDDKKRLLSDFQRLNKTLAAYAKYNKKLEKKLQTFKVDLSELENSADFVHTQRQTLFSNSNQSNSHSSNLLCEGCSENVNRKFQGVHKNTQLLGDELLDCIDDNLSLEAAIFSFMEQKTDLEQQVASLEVEQRDLERDLLNSSILSGSFSSLDSEFSRRDSLCGLLSTRSKSMPMLLVDVKDEFNFPRRFRSHTALGICSFALLKRHRHDSSSNEQFLNESFFSQSSEDSVNRVLDENANELQRSDDINSSDDDENLKTKNNNNNNNNNIAKFLRRLKTSKRQKKKHNEKSRNKETPC